LNRHRKTIRFLWTSYVEHPSPNQPIGPFPQLSTCYASIHLLPIILPGSLVNEIGISFVDDFYPDMQLCCMDDLPITTVSFEVWEGTAGSAMACLSRMTSVEEACIELDCESNNTVVELLELLSGIIGLLRNLRILEINLYVDPSSLSNDSSRYHDEWVTLQAWTGPCPTLIECKMPSGVTWHKPFLEHPWVPDIREKQTQQVMDIEIQHTECQWWHR